MFPHEMENSIAKLLLMLAAACLVSKVPLLHGKPVKFICTTIEVCLHLLHIFLSDLLALHYDHCTVTDVM